MYVCNVCACATAEFGIESWVKTSRTCCVKIVGRSELVLLRQENIKVSIDFNIQSGLRDCICP